MPYIYIHTYNLKTQIPRSKVFFFLFSFDQKKKKTRKPKTLKSNLRIIKPSIEC